MEILVLSDGSTDDTDAIAREFEPRGVRLLQLPHCGKPAALSAAFPLVRSEIVLLTDVRQVLEPGSVRALIACFSDPDVGVVSGTLSIYPGKNSEQVSTTLYWKYESWIRRSLSRCDSLLGATGPFYAIRRELLVPIPPHILLDDVYLPVAAVLKGYRSVLAEDAVAYDFAASIQAEFRRKVRTQAGVYQILRTIPALLGPRNRLWGAFWSLKVGRLLLPYLLIAFAACSALLPPPWAAILLSLQGLFCILAFADPWFPDHTLLKRLSSACRSFASLALAALCGISVFFLPPQTLWKPTAIKPESARSSAAEH